MDKKKGQPGLDEKSASMQGIEKDEKFVIAIAGADDYPKIELYGRHGSAGIFAETVAHVARALGQNNVQETIVEITGPVADRIMAALSDHGVPHMTSDELMSLYDE